MILIDTLALAVPLWMDRLSGELATRRGELIVSWANDAADAVSSHGDVLQFGGRRGEAASVFNALSRGLAALAWCPGGVTWLGTLWCARHWPMGTVAADGGICAPCADDPAARAWPDRLARPQRVIREVQDTIPKEGLL